MLTVQKWIETHWTFWIIIFVQRKMTLIFNNRQQPTFQVQKEFYLFFLFSSEWISKTVVACSSSCSSFIEDVGDTSWQLKLSRSDIAKDWGSIRSTLTKIKYFYS